MPGLGRAPQRPAPKQRRPKRANGSPACKSNWRHGTPTSAALTEAGAELGRLERQIAALQGAVGEADSAKAAVTAAQEEARTESARAAQAEAAAAAAQETAAAARQDLADREAELASLRDELRALRQKSQASAQSATASPPSRASTWRADWLAPVLAALLLAGGLAALLAVSRRRQAGRAPVGQETQSASRRASEARPKTAPEPRPAAAVEPPAAPRPVRVRAPVEDIPVENVPAVRPVPRPATDRPTPAATVTSATIVEAVRRQDWASADAQFSQLSGVSSPGLKDLLEDPSGELLALACRAADLDRLTFAALYLLQGQPVRENRPGRGSAKARGAPRQGLPLGLRPSRKTLGRPCATP
jgi:hypothetical protein